MLDVPLAAHCFVASFTTFGIEQNPSPPSSRLGAAARIVLAESSLYIRGPADIGSTIIFAPASEHIDETLHLRFGSGLIRAWRLQVGLGP
jgi:hypothetical protein